MNFVQLLERIKSLGNKPRPGQILSTAATINHAFLTGEINPQEAFELMQQVWFLWPNKRC